MRGRSWGWWNDQPRLGLGIVAPVIIIAVIELSALIRLISGGDYHLKALALQTLVNT